MASPFSVRQFCDLTAEQSGARLQSGHSVMRKSASATCCRRANQRASQRIINPMKRHQPEKLLRQQGAEKRKLSSAVADARSAAATGHVTGTGLAVRPVGAGVRFHLFTCGRSASM